MDLAPARHVSLAPRTRANRLRAVALRTAVGLAFGAAMGLLPVVVLMWEELDEA